MSQPNDSSTGGYLLPSGPPAPVPLTGKSLNEFIQPWLAAISGLDGTLVRPAWQAEPASIPDAGTAWMAFRLTKRIADTYPYVKHYGTAVSAAAYSELQRHEELDILCSFYDLGTNGQADFYASQLRDGTVISQNWEALQIAGFAFVCCGEMLPVPSLLKVRWLYRVDLPITVRRAIVRRYPILDVASLDGQLVANDAGDRVITQPLSTKQP